ncbi:MAG: leucine-rich repeat domain-containing protein [Oscillospiraceae bacterium]|nr:leucine-rich repeat domain-containing protein [Oscillospiraceae bacterium]
MGKALRTLLAAGVVGAAMLCLRPLPAAAELFYSDDGLWMVNVYEENDDVSITCTDKTIEEVDIPSEVNGYTINMVEVDAFNGNEVLRRVTIPETVRVIDDYAFYGCSSLEEVNIPKNLKKLGFQSFYGCAKITEMTIPATVEEVELFAFEGCNALPAVEVDPANKNYKDVDGILFNKDGSTLFLYPSAKEGTHYDVPATVERVEDFAFIGNPYLETVDLGQIKELGEGAFYYCTALQSLEVPATVSQINGSLVGGCRSLTSISLPEGIPAITSGCFYGCLALTDVTIPESVYSIDSYAFFNCPLLKTIRVSPNVTSIGDYALGFYYKGEGDPVRLPGFKVDTERDTEAFRYCAKNGIACTAGITQNGVFIGVLIGVFAAVLIVGIAAAIISHKHKKEEL